MATESPPVHEWTGPTGVHFRDVREPDGTYYHDTTPRKVVAALQAARQSGSRVRLFYGDQETGRDRMEEWSVTGTIGRSWGPIKIPLLIANSRSMGGGAILCDSIVRLLVNGREVYRHPKYHLPTLVMHKTGTYPELPWEVTANGKGHARFKTEPAAKRWIAFMRGERLSK